MKKFLVSTLVVSGLTLTGVGSYALQDQPTGAETEQQMEQPANHEANLTEVKGEVLSVKGTSVEVKDEAGMTHSFDTTGIDNADEFTEEPLQTGDMVKVEIDGGKATSIERIEADDKASTEDPAMGEDELSAEDPAVGEGDIAAEEPALGEGDVAAEDPAAGGDDLAANEEAAKEHPQDADSMKEDGTAEIPDTGTDEAATEAELGEETAAEGEYIVKEGDTLAEIAEEELGSQDKWGLIARANNIENPDTIYVGQRLSIPSDTEFESEEFEQNQEFAPEESGENEPAMDDSEKPAGSY